MPDRGPPLVVKDLISIASHADEIAWAPFKDGVQIYRLYGDDSQGPAAAILRYEQGASVPLHTHQGYEHILILAGSQTDGTEVFESGSLLISAPGSSHRIASESGCIVLAIWQAPVEFSKPLNN
jgi:anti-sigma factor ChrR (cupin superfamily)